MKCRECKKLLFQYIDEELKPDTAAEIKMHLSSCKECGKELRYIKEYKKELASVGTLRAPDDFAGNVLWKIDKLSTGRRILDFLFNPVKIKLPVEAVGLAIVCLFIIYSIKSGNVMDNAYFAKNEAVSDEMEYEAKKPDVQTRSVVESPAPEKKTKEKKEFVSLKKSQKATERDYKKRTVVYQIAFLEKQSVTETTALASAKVPPVETGKVKSARSHDSIAGEKERREETNAKAGSYDEDFSRAEITDDDDEEAAGETAPEDYFRELSRIVNEYDGRILEEDGKNKDNGKIISVEIPEANREKFISGLKKIGKILSGNQKTAGKENDDVVKVLVEIDY